MHTQKLWLPDSLKEEQKSREEQPPDVPACDVCKKSHDSHLMALCDTCDKHYHIGCLDPPLTKVPKKSAKWGWLVTVVTKRERDRGEEKRKRWG